MHRIGTTLAALAICGALLTPGEARPWKPQGEALAEDYAQIIDSRPGGDLVLLMWIVPQIVKSSPTAAAMLDKYVVLGVVHGHVQAGGIVSFEDVTTLAANDGDGKPLKLLQGADLPADVAGGVAGISGVMRQTIGQMGQGMHFFAFEGGVHACEKGQLSIPFAGETYIYDTPIPGCPKP